MRNVTVICYEELLIKTELRTTELSIYVHFKVKPSMKNKCYNVIVKFITESEDIIAAACTCPGGSGVTCHVSSVFENAITFMLFFLLCKSLIEKI